MRFEYIDGEIDFNAKKHFEIVVCSPKTRCVRGDLREKPRRRLNSTFGVLIFYAHLPQDEHHCKKWNQLRSFSDRGRRLTIP